MQQSDDTPPCWRLFRQRKQSLRAVRHENQSFNGAS